MVVALSGRYPKLIEKAKVTLGPMERRKLNEINRVEREEGAFQQLEQANQDYVVMAVAG